MKASSALLALLARRNPSPDARVRARALWPAVDASELVQLAVRGGVAGLVAQNLEHLGQANPSLQRQLAMCALAQQVQSQRLFAEARHLLALAQKEDLRLIPLKGVALLIELYDSTGLRSMTDIDLLVARSNYERADALLRAAGYEPQGCQQWERALGHYHVGYARKELVVELHWSAFFAYQCPRVDDLVFSRCVDRLSDGVRITLLDREAQLLALLLHVASHRFRGQLKWLVDAAEYARQHGPSWAGVERLAQQLGATRALRHGAALAAQQLDAPLPVVAQPALARLASADAVLQSAAQGSWLWRLALDALLFDRPSRALRQNAGKLLELVTRPWTRPRADR